LLGLCFLTTSAVAGAREGGIGNLTLNGDAGTVSGVLEVSGNAVGSVLFHIKKTDLRNGELILTGQLTATAGRATQTVAPVTMTLSDADGVCESMAATNSAFHLKRLGIEIESAPSDVTLSATSATGRVFANLLCGVTHLLDDPGPLTSTAAAMNGLINRSLAAIAANPAAATAATAMQAPTAPPVNEQPRARVARPSAASYAAPQQPPAGYPQGGYNELQAQPQQPQQVPSQVYTSSPYAAPVYPQQQTYGAPTPAATPDQPVHTYPATAYPRSDEDDGSMQYRR
jgi:hypothetical protein